VEARAAADPVCQRLTSVPGVGPITAFQFKSSIEDPERLSTARRSALTPAWRPDAHSQASGT